MPALEIPWNRPTWQSKKHGTDLPKTIKRSFMLFWTNQMTLLPGARSKRTNLLLTYFVAPHQSAQWMDYLQRKRLSWWKQVGSFSCCRTENLINKSAIMQWYILLFNVSILRIRYTVFGHHCGTVFGTCYFFFL